jgi:hypothetical protein
VIAEQFAMVLAIRSLATATNVLQWFPHLIQLATGLSAFALVANMVEASIYLPGILFLTPVYGVVVPVILWLMVNLLQFAPMVVMTHRRALTGETWRWIDGSVLRPILVTCIIVTISRYFAPNTEGWLITIPWLAAWYLVAMCAVLLASSRTRSLFAAAGRVAWALAKSKGRGGLG